MQAFQARPQERKAFLRLSDAAIEQDLCDDGRGFQPLGEFGARALAGR
jgi:hypothetical protein